MLLRRFSGLNGLGLPYVASGSRTPPGFNAGGLLADRISSSRVLVICVVSVSKRFFFSTLFVFIFGLDATFN